MSTIVTAKKSKRVLLGLLGSPIAHSATPAAQEAAARAAGIEAHYHLIEIADAGRDDLVAMLDGVRRLGFSGINVTFPYKEAVVPLLDGLSEQAAAMGAVNTIVVDGARLIGHNTDASGFATAYRRLGRQDGDESVAIIGAGGVGKAIAFGLLGLGATDIRLTDKDAARAAGLARALAAASPHLRVSVHPSAAEAVAGADGVVNCTPVGMVGYEGTPVSAEALRGASWAFDAVYTPLDTTFLRDAAAVGLTCISGFELFFHQGIQAFRIFTGLDVPEKHLRQRLIAAATNNQGRMT